MGTAFKGESGPSTCLGEIIPQKRQANTHKPFNKSGPELSPSGVILTVRVWWEEPAFQKMV